MLPRPMRSSLCQYPFVRATVRGRLKSFLLGEALGKFVGNRKAACRGGEMAANTRAQFEVVLRGNKDDKVPLEFENKDHEQHFQKLLEMKVPSQTFVRQLRRALPVRAVHHARERG